MFLRPHPGCFAFSWIQRFLGGAKVGCWVRPQGCLVILTLYLLTLLRSVQLSFTRFTMLSSLEHLSAYMDFSALPFSALPSQPPPGLHALASLPSPAKLKPPLRSPREIPP